MNIGKGFIPFINLKKVRIELPSGELCDIDFTKNIPQEALFAKYVLTDWRSLYEILSHFHKALRLGSNPLALNWGRIYAMKTSERAVKRYMRKVCLEECKNLTLFKQLVDDDTSLEAQILSFTNAAAYSCTNWPVIPATTGHQFL